MTVLDFHPVMLNERQLVDQYMSEYGEGSCQHAFVTMYALHEKYGDEICEKDGFLYVLRSGLCDETYRVYLAPMGSGDLSDAFRTVLEDAHSHGCKAKFFTLTQKTAAFLDEHFPGAFSIQNDRDLAEYFFSTKQLSAFSGGSFKQKRKELHQFQNTYGDRLSFSPITAADIPEILTYEEAWLAENLESHDEHALSCEQRCIIRVLTHWQELGVSGSVMRIDGCVRGFFLGFPLNETCFDGMFEKCDKSLRFSYRAMMNEVGRHCAGRYPYLNAEEDLGIEGLRTMKLAYNPVFLLEKYIASEN